MTEVKREVKLVINNKYGGFHLSPDAFYWLKKRGSALVENVNEDDVKRYDGWGSDIQRDHPDLIAVVEALGTNAGDGLVIKVATVSIQIGNYDGCEWIESSGVWCEI